MIAKRRTFIALAVVALAAASPACAPAQDAGPTLVVLISVDQLRGDLMARYAPVFTGGLRRLAEEGRSYPGASHAHAITHTAAGHAALATGVFPSRSGIVANSWTQQVGGEWEGGMYAVADPDAPILGSEGAQGRSPANMLRGGLADWVVAADPEARVVSLSAKDRSAITMAGHVKGHVYWLQSSAGRFVTSGYYRSSYPGWVEDFNQRLLPQIMADPVWDTSVPEEYRALALPDSAGPYEGDGVHTTFPHLASAEVPEGFATAYNSWVLSQPRADQAVLELARVAIDELELGQRGRVDFLALGLSATDYVGHAYGPWSQEQLDNLVRMDRGLGELFRYLDQAVGSGRWVVGFSADHGVISMPENLVAIGEAAQRVDARERQEALSGALQDAAARVGGDMDRLPEVLSALLESRNLVAKAYTHRELLAGEPADSFATLFRNSHYPGRAHGPLSRFGVEIRFGYNDLVSFPTGTSHGSPYWYDRWVPFILMGAGVRSGESSAAVYTVDMAPTLAALAGIPVPDDLDGTSVYR